MHPTDAMFHWAKHYPQRLALILPNMAVTYKALAEAIDAVSDRIERYEFDPRKPVAVAITDPSKFLAVCHGLLRNGITCAPVASNAFAHLLANNINTLIFSGESNAVVGVRNIRFDDSWLRAKPSVFATAGKNDSRPYGDLIFFTSGTTGIPKKVVVPGDAFTERLNMLPVTGEAMHRRVLILPGLGSVFGFNRAASVLYAGKTVCFAHGAEAQLRFVTTFGIDAIVGSTQQISDLVDVAEKGTKYRSESLKEVWVSGGFASNELIQRVRLALCRNVIIVYGSSESGFVASARYDLISHIPQAVGFVTPDMRIEIVDATNTPVPAGEEGLVRGHSDFIAQIFAANNPEKAAESDDAWWYPGDLGRLTSDGILCISGRTDEIINMGGVKIAASLLDEEVRRFPGIRDAGVCGVRGKSGMDEAWIGVVSDTKVDIGDLRKWIEETQAETIRVGEIIVIDQLPRNALGKLERYQLKALLLGMKSRALSEWNR